MKSWRCGISWRFTGDRVGARRSAQATTSTSRRTRPPRGPSSSSGRFSQNRTATDSSSTIATASIRLGSTPPSRRWRTPIVRDSSGRYVESAWTISFRSGKRISGGFFASGRSIITERGHIASWDPACRSHPLGCRLPRSWPWSPVGYQHCGASDLGWAPSRVWS